MGIREIVLILGIGIASNPLTTNSQGPHGGEATQSIDQIRMTVGEGDVSGLIEVKKPRDADYNSALFLNWGTTYEATGFAHLVLPIDLDDVRAIYYKAKELIDMRPVVLESSEPWTGYASYDLDMAKERMDLIIELLSHRESNEEWDTIALQGLGKMYATHATPTKAPKREGGGGGDSGGEDGRSQTETDPVGRKKRDLFSTMAVAGLTAFGASMFTHRELSHIKKQISATKQEQNLVVRQVEENALRITKLEKHVEEVTKNRGL